MYFQTLVKEKYSKEKVSMFIDMDGVIADYDVGNPLNFQSKRPVTTNINTIKEISKYSNITLYILSICHFSYQVEEKNNWLDKNAPFFKKENRIIIPKELHKGFESKELKFQALKEYLNNNKETKIVVVDDDNVILKYLKKELPNIDLYHNSSIQD